MELQTISQVSKTFGISTRMLRYYEQIGILTSQIKAGYAYRTYDENAISKLQHIILLRKLRIPLKQISEILSNRDAYVIIEVFMRNVSELNSEIKALSVIRTILTHFIDELQENTYIQLSSVLFSDKYILNLIDSLSLTKINFKEERSMEELNKAHESLSKLKDVRIVRLPSCSVAASHYIGTDPELEAGSQLCEFIKKSDLYHIKPDARVFGFDHPKPSSNKPYGYEIWVTIPDDFEVLPPLVKKHFEGGLFAAHMIEFGNFHEWEWLHNWVNIDNPKYESNCTNDNGEYSGGCLEEYPCYIYNHYHNWPESAEHQLDLMVPIKLK